VTTNYDEFKNSTSVSVGPMRLNTGSSSRDLEMEAVFSYPGKILEKAVNGALVRFSTHSAPGNFSNFEVGPEWLTIIDGTRERFGTMRYSVSKNVEVAGRVTEELTMLTARDGLKNLAYASSVKMRVGDLECELTPDQISELKRFVDKMTAGLGDVSPALELLDWTYQINNFGTVHASVKIRNPTNADNSESQAVITCSNPSGDLSKGERYLGTIPAKSIVVKELVDSFEGINNQSKCEVTFETLIDHKPIKTIVINNHG
jgi:hypothetical protein